MAWTKAQAANFTMFVIRRVGAGAWTADVLSKVVKMALLDAELLDVVLSLKSDADTISIAAIRQLRSDMRKAGNL